MKKLLIILCFSSLICSAKAQDKNVLSTTVKQYTVTPEMFGAKGDNITDDLLALNAAVKYLGSDGGTIFLDKGYRITDTWVLGESFINENDGLQRNFTLLKSFNLPKYLSAIKKKPIKIIASSKGGIYGDFKSDTLKAIIFYAMYGDSRAWPGDEKYAAEISNLAVYGQGNFVNGIATIRGDNNGYDYTNNQIGILALNTFKMQVSNCTFYGLKKGLVLNNSYFSNLTNNYYKLCDVGLLHLQSHGSIITNNIAYYCNKGYEIRSGQIVMNNINSEQCKIGLHIVNGMNVVNGCYLEANRTSGLSQLIVGADIGDEGYIEGNKAGGIIINAITIAVSNTDGSIGNNVMLKSTADDVHINGGMLYSGHFTKTGTSGRIIANGVYGDLPSWAYVGSEKIVTTDITARGKITAPSLTADAITSKEIKAEGIQVGHISIDGNIIQESSFNNIKIESKLITGLQGSRDYILRLGKCNVADNTKIVGTLFILGNNSSVFAGSGHFNISYTNFASGFAKSSFTSMTDTYCFQASIVTYKEAGELYAGIRFTTTCTLAWIPCQFYFTGVLSTGAFRAISTLNVTEIAPLVTANSKYQILTNELSIPHLKTGGAKKLLYVDGNGKITTE